MGGASSFIAMLGICGFLSSAWIASKVSKLAGVSSIVAEITVGVILGPQLLSIVPREYSVCEHAKYVDCTVSDELRAEIDAFTPLEELTLTEPLENIAFGEHHGHPFCDYDAYMHAAHDDDHGTGEGHSDTHDSSSGVDHNDDHDTSASVDGHQDEHASAGGDHHDDHDSSASVDDHHDEHASSPGGDHHDDHDSSAGGNHHDDHDTSASVDDHHDEHASAGGDHHDDHDTSASVDDHHDEHASAGGDHHDDHDSSASVDDHHDEHASAGGDHHDDHDTSAGGDHHDDHDSSASVDDHHDEHASAGGDHHDDHHHDDHDTSASVDDHHTSAGGDDHHDHGRLLSLTGKPSFGKGQDGGFMRARRLSGDLKYSSYDECLEMWCIQERTHMCGLTPDVFTLIGHTGVAMMIFESGMHFNFDTAKVVGPKACVVAVVGTILPLVTGSILVVIFGRPFFPDGVSAGTALAPTSVGIALKLLGEAKVLNMNFGQAIITAAFVDDILSLILFNILFALGGGELGFGTFLPSLLGIAFMIFATGLAVVFWPKAISEYILPRVPVRDPNAKISSKDEALFFGMMVLMVVYACITHFCGTHLWGCFIAGMSFASLKPDHYAAHVWEVQTKRVTKWLLRIFFCGTVAWSIPVGSLMSFEAFWKGTLMGIGPCILTKVCCGPFMGKDKWVIGWAMVGRAEFAYLIAQMAAAGNMMDEMTYSVCIWALLYATVFAPFIFRAVLKKYIEKEGIIASEGGDHGHGEAEQWSNVMPADEREAAVHNDVKDIDFTAAVKGVEAQAETPEPNRAFKPAPKASKGSGTSCGSFFACIHQEQVGLKP